MPTKTIWQPSPWDFCDDLNLLIAPFSSVSTAKLTSALKMKQTSSLDEPGRVQVTPHTDDIYKELKSLNLYILKCSSYKDNIPNWKSPILEGASARDVSFHYYSHS